MLPLSYLHSILLGTYAHKFQQILLMIVENPIAFINNEQIGQPGYCVGGWNLASISHRGDNLEKSSNFALEHRNRPGKKKKSLYIRQK